MTDEGQWRLDGKVALITGGARARGQGAAEGRLFASRGATVILADVVDDEGERTAGEIAGDLGEGGGSVEYAHLDVTSETEWDAVVDDAVARHGRLDVVINNAGVARMGRLVNVTLDDWNLTMAVNQTGVMLGMRAGARAMIDCANGGAIVNISSVAGMVGLFGSMSYGASKWAVRGMTKIAAKELGRHGIRVNSIHPGFIATDMLDEGDFGDEELARMARSAPVGRIGEPADIANMALYLSCDAASFVTGQEFVVDGGWYG